MSLGMQEILPDGGLASFQNHVSRIADLGRYEDAYIVHAAEGETVVPMAVFDENPRLKAMLFAQMRGMGIDPQQYIVGNELNSINPVTGQPEFFLKKIFKGAKKALKAVAPYAGLIAGAMGAGPWYSALAGGIGGLYGSEGDLGAGAMGALGGYGAGTAFGTAGWAGGAKEGFTGNPYIFGDKAAGVSSWDQLKSNIGFGGSTTAGGDAEIAKRVGAPAGTSVEDIVMAGGEPYERYARLVEHGIIKNPASAMTGWEKAILFGGPALGVAGEYFSGDKDDSEVDWGPSYVPWGGNFAAPGVTYANGGIINAYDNGGEVGGYTAGRDMAILEKDWRIPSRPSGDDLRHNFETFEEPLTIEDIRTESKWAQRLQGKHLNEAKNSFIAWAKEQVSKAAKEAKSGMESMHLQRMKMDEMNEMYNKIFMSDRFGTKRVEPEFPPRSIPGIPDEWGGTMEAQSGGIINAYDNGGPVDRHPGMDERMSSEELQEKLLKLGIVNRLGGVPDALNPVLGGTDPRVESLIESRNELLRQEEQTPRMQPFADFLRRREDVEMTAEDLIPPDNRRMMMEELLSTGKTIRQIDKFLNALTNDQSRAGLTGQVNEMIQMGSGSIAELMGMDTNELAYMLARARKSSGRINEDDVQRARESLSMRGFRDAKSALVELHAIQEELKDSHADKMLIFQFEGGELPEGYDPIKRQGDSPRITYDEEGNVQDVQFPWESGEDYTINPNVRAHAGREYTEDKYADGGIAHLANGAFPRRSGAIAGPGGPKDDMVPAMLSDGEFVMTADAVRNAGGGDRREGARRMYQLMNQLQGAA